MGTESKVATPPINTAEMDARIARAAPVFDAAQGGIATGLAAAGIVFTVIAGMVMGAIGFSPVLVLGIAKLRSATKKLKALDG